MFMHKKMAIIGCLVTQSLTSFALAELPKNEELRILFQKSRSPELSDLRLEEKWSCSVDNIQFVFGLNSEKKLTNKTNSNPFIAYQLGKQALKRVEKKPTQEKTREHIRVLKDMNGNGRGDLIVEELADGDFDDTLPVSLVDKNYRVLQYYTCLQSKVSPLHALAQQKAFSSLDLNLNFHSNDAFIDFSLPNITVNISEAEVKEQEESYAASILFETALPIALRNLYEDNGKRALFTRIGRSPKKLQSILNKTSTILELLTPSQAMDSPFGSELLEKYWIFQLKIGDLDTDETFWIFVSRTGTEEKVAYNRSFN
ncbi:MAG: hypothetical protein HY559_01490 [Gammaproteobacteria bacterium]|nr:hypothetical protein [Gammaproteobacteria bacterium]